MLALAPHRRDIFDVRANAMSDDLRNRVIAADPDYNPAACMRSAPLPATGHSSPAHRPGSLIGQCPACDTMANRWIDPMDRLPYDPADDTNADHARRFGRGMTPAEAADPTGEWREGGTS